MTQLERLRQLIAELSAILPVYNDASLRSIKNTAEVFSMHIRMELAARDARAIDQILQEKAK